MKKLKKCPKCGIDLLQIAHTTSKTSIVDQLPYKSQGTAALIVFIGGIFLYRSRSYILEKELEY